MAIVLPRAGNTGYTMMCISDTPGRDETMAALQFKFEGTSVDIVNIGGRKKSIAVYPPFRRTGLLIDTDIEDRVIQ